jgi:hypothetical protein
MKQRHSKIGARAGKSPQKNIRTSLTESKYESGGAGMKSKKGGVIRKPKAKIRYKHKKSVV